MSESSPLNPGMADDGESGDFTLPELVDLALCSPEVGAVNFNILRILLHNIIEKLGIVDQKATLNDLQAHQINVSLPLPKRTPKNTSLMLTS